MSALLGALLVVSCNPFAQPAQRLTREPEPTFHPLAGSATLGLVQRSAAATYAVAYAASGEFEGRQVTGTWTTYQRPPQTRLDVSMTAQDGRIELRTYISPDGVVVCQMGAAPMCRPPAEAVGDASASNLLAQRPQDYSVVARERLRLAEEQTQCFLFRPNEGVDSSFKEAFICFADDGVPLMVDMDLRDGSGFLLEGRIVKRTVSDAEIRPPTPGP